MKLVLFGATGNAGKEVVTEALARGHTVTAVSRHPEKTQLAAGVIQVQGDVSDPQRVAELIPGTDAVISTVSPQGLTGDPEVMAKVVRSLLKGLTQTGVRRLLVLGNTGSLEIAPGMRLMDTPDFPPRLKPIAEAHLKALQTLQNEALPEVDWTFFSPGITQNGPRTGHYRVGGNQILTNPAGQPSPISWGDMAVAMLNELENPRYLRQRITTAY